MEIQLIEIPEFPKLHGKEAIEALCDFVKELEEQRGRELTDEQTNALIKFAWGLSSSVEAEMHARAHSIQISDKPVKQIHKETDFGTKLRKAITKYIPESVWRHTRNVAERLA